MRHTLRATAFFVGIVVLSLGCAQDKYKMHQKFPEEYTEVPNEARYNLPDKASYRKPAAPAKEEKTAIGGRPGAGNSPGLGGF